MREENTGEEDTGRNHTGGEGGLGALLVEPVPLQNSLHTRGQLQLQSVKACQALERTKEVLYNVVLKKLASGNKDLLSGDYLLKAGFTNTAPCFQ